MAMIRVEMAMGPPTSGRRVRMRSFMLPVPWGPRCRKVFSIMITVESTTMPKSSAPSEMRFAGVSVSFMPAKAMSSAMGMLMAVISAARPLPRNRKSTTVTSSMPSRALCSTVCVVSRVSVPRL